METREIWGYE